ncbi:MAG: hypothetical protein GDA39_05865 [Hyphomonadaceae bacterium]|nr:hypothetical protein [Hyphomonadaceae bacterium]MBC6412431.1 hypothetical protein [Hyphomonadaceae bacterium]
MTDRVSRTVAMDLLKTANPVEPGGQPEGRAFGCFGFLFLPDRLGKRIFDLSMCRVFAMGCPRLRR